MIQAWARGRSNMQIHLNGFKYGDQIYSVQMSSLWLHQSPAMNPCNRCSDSQKALAMLSASPEKQIFTLHLHTCTLHTITQTICSLSVGTDLHLQKKRERHPSQQGVDFLFKCCWFILVYIHLKSLFFSSFVCSSFLKCVQLQLWS